MNSRYFMSEEDEQLESYYDECYMDDGTIIKNDGMALMPTDRYKKLFGIIDKESTEASKKVSSKGTSSLNEDI